MGAIILSVINKMLKDLDQRQHERQTKAASNGQTIPMARQATKVWLIVLVSVVTTLLLVYGGYLFTQNQQLIAEKPKNKVQQSNNQSQNNQLPSNNIKSTKAHAERAITANTNQEQLLENDQKITFIPQAEPATYQEISQQTKEKLQKTSAKAKPNKITTKQSNITSAVVAADDNVNTDIFPKKSEKATIKQAPLSQKEPQVSIPAKASITVSRRQLTTEQLATQKMKQAEQALSANNAVKAEKLFEEILMLQPDNKTARKQLAALWFGRKAYQEALNVLAQGIALDPQYSEFRLMQARIYLTQGYSEQAYQVLQGLPFTHNVEYLATQASVAQQLTKYPQAISAYQQLIKLQPNEARWWLGLAVVYDLTNDYTLALPAYQSALAQGNLSASSVDFVQQRMQELRE